MEEERKNSEIADSLCDILEKQNVSTKNVEHVLATIKNWNNRRINLENKRRELHNIIAQYPQLAEEIKKPAE